MVNLIHTTVKARGYSLNASYELCEATLVGTAHKFWVFLLSQTDTRDKLGQEPTVDVILAIAAYALRRELSGFSLSMETVEKEQFFKWLDKVFGL